MGDEGIRCGSIEKNIVFSKQKREGYLKIETSK